MIYLDNNATTPLAPEVREAMLPYLGEVFANPSSPHSAGMRARQAVGEAREAVAGLIGARTAEVVFTANATEANHLAILGSLRAVTGRRHVVTSAVEHPATLLLMADLERQGWRVTRLPVDAAGRVRPADLAAAVTGDTALVSLMWANNETGVLMPVAEAARIARSAGALFHTDAVQAVGRLAVDLQELPADYLSFSAHKLHGPKGVGVLFARRGAPLNPLIFGHQERKRRGGTENVPAIAGLGAAAQAAAAWLDAGGPARIADLRDQLERGVLSRLPGSMINGVGDGGIGDGAGRVANTANISIVGPDGRAVEGEALLIRLDRAGILVSMGAACSAGGMEPSHVLRAMGLSAAQAQASLRFSLSRYTTGDDIRAVLDTLPPLVARLAA